MYRSHTCGELRLEHVGQEVTLSGWVNKNRDFGAMTFVDVRDRYGITQIVVDAEDDATYQQAKKLGREFVIRVNGKVRERTNKNPNIPTGDIEIEVSKLEILNASKVPPFTLDDETDGGDDLRMSYRYLDLRRKPVQSNLIFRGKLAIATRTYMDSQGFIEVETPVLIKSTPEGARDFVVPSRMNPGQFYALPQSPQTFKQLLMVSGLDKYFQIVKCFRDEDLRADRQPEFTQIDCEMSFVTRDDVLNTFEGLVKHLFKVMLNVELGDFPRMTYDEAMKLYGSDKPDTRFEMKFVELNELRLEMGNRMGLRDGGFQPLWVVDFPLLEWDEDSQRFHAMHHPFTSARKEDMQKMMEGGMDKDAMEALRADAYDLVINGWEIGGGSIRIHDREVQSRNFELLGFTPEEAEEQFGFLLGAFEYGAPPHGGIAFGFDRLCSIMQHSSSIRDFIAFPKNNQGRDVMLNAPAFVDTAQLDELSLELKKEIELDS